MNSNKTTQLDPIKTKSVYRLTMTKLSSQHERSLQITNRKRKEDNIFYDKRVILKPQCNKEVETKEI